MIHLVYLFYVQQLTTRTLKHIFICQVFLLGLRTLTSWFNKLVTEWTNFRITAKMKQFKEKGKNSNADKLLQGRA